MRASHNPQAAKKKLETAGWFDAGRKRPLPAHPARIGIVTSRRAAALRDILTTLARRCPGIPVVIYPAAVLKSSKSPDAVPFLDYLEGPKARPAFEKQGFTVLVKSNSST